MARNNKTISRIFTEIVRDRLYDKFFTLNTDLKHHECETQSAMKKLYTQMLDNMKPELGSISKVEEIIIQLRAKEQIDTELRLSLSRHYIYARTLFFRMDKEINDIRVIVGKTTDYGDNIENLITQPQFRSICKEALIKTIDEIINTNLKNLYGQ